MFKLKTKTTLDNERVIKMSSEVTIDGVVYVPKTQKPTGNYVIVRSNMAGVFAGELELREGNGVILNNARRLWFWSGAATLSELAVKGVKNPDKCKFPIEVEKIILPEVCEIIPASEECRKSIAKVAEWKA